FGRKPVVYRKAKYDLIIFPEGYHSEDIVKLFELENEDMAFWSGASGVALDIGELAGILSPGDMGISDVVAVADLLAATLAS
ncbi:MAG: hypothetical protein GWO20_07820, partial [Candidatus Korarchaeota archaeon]|nr:hypothetical protein [Candidatus Korarchaeota archaeon]